MSFLHRVTPMELLLVELQRLIHTIILQLIKLKVARNLTILIISLTLQLRTEQSSWIAAITTTIMDFRVMGCLVQLEGTTIQWCIIQDKISQITRNSLMNHKMMIKSREEYFSIKNRNISLKTNNMKRY